MAVEDIFLWAEWEFRRRGFRHGMSWRRGSVTPIEAIHCAFTGTPRQPIKTNLYEDAVRVFALAVVGHLSDHPIDEIALWSEAQDRTAEDVINAFESARHLAPLVPRRRGPES